ncbi:unnamed protein product [Rhizophagus irregularis]|uniref:Uncharacterized protein n=1 Tax=Rhizophagus irregularis TaxID=588596 RepID=A0A915Z076_9GLOM|nr:unnamed protein product [Rhizophagus irregularis]
MHDRHCANLKLIHTFITILPKCTLYLVIYTLPSFGLWALRSLGYTWLAFQVSTSWRKTDDFLEYSDAWKTWIQVHSSLQLENLNFKFQELDSKSNLMISSFILFRQVASSLGTLNVQIMMDLLFFGCLNNAEFR